MFVISFVDVTKDKDLGEAVFPHLEKLCFIFDLYPESFYRLFGIAVTARCLLELDVPAKDSLEYAPGFEESTWSVCPNASFALFLKAHPELAETTMSGTGGPVSDAAQSRLDLIRARSAAVGRGGTKRRGGGSTANVPKRPRRPTQVDQRVAAAVAGTQNPSADVVGTQNLADVAGGSNLGDDQPHVDGQSTVAVPSAALVTNPKGVDPKGKGTAAASSRRQFVQSILECPSVDDMKVLFDNIVGRHASLITNNCELKAVVARQKKDMEKMASNYEKKTSELEVAQVSLFEAKSDCNALNLELISVRAEASRKQVEMDAQMKAIITENAQLKTQLGAANSEIAKLAKINDETYEAYEGIVKEFE